MKRKSLLEQLQFASVLNKGLVETIKLCGKSYVAIIGFQFGFQFGLVKKKAQVTPD